MLLLVGLLAILSQIVLLRELNVAFYGVELVYALALAGWMAGSAIGSLLWRRDWSPGANRVAWLLAAAAAALPANVAWIRSSRIVMGGIPGAYLPFPDQVLVLLVSVIPQAAMLGLAFRWAAQLAASAGRSLARSYAVESAGACVGALAATAGFMAGMQTFSLAVLTAGLVPAALAGWASWRGLAAPPAPPRLRWLAVPAILVVATAVASAFSPDLDLAMTAWGHPSVVESRDSPYARITATRAGSQAALFLDDVLVYESETVQPEELAHVAALAHPAPRRILVLGGSVSGIDRELAKHAPERVVAVELDGEYVEAGRRLGPVSPVVLDDPRSFLRKFPRGEFQKLKFLPRGLPTQFDLIVVAMPQPTSGQSNRFYTREFFGECRERLAPGGIVAFSLDLPENVVSPLLAMRTSSIVEAARSAFPAVRVLRGTSAIVLASPAPLPGDGEAMIARWHERRLSVRLVTPAYLHYLWDNDRRLELEGRLRVVRALPNSDARPVCYQVAAVNWLARFFPRLLTLEPRAQWAVPVLAVLGAVAAATIVLARRSGAVSRGVQAGLGGFAGMLLETVLLLAYQAWNGALYERLGLLLLVFMLGLAVGAATVGRLLAAARAIRRVASAIYAALLLLGGVVAVLVGSGTAAGLWWTAVLMFAAGAITAGVFACAAAQPAVTGRSIGPLYGADLAGGAAGSLLAGMVLVPSTGLASTAWVVCGAGVVGLLLVRR